MHIHHMRFELSLLIAEFPPTTCLGILFLSLGGELVAIARRFTWEFRNADSLGALIPIPDLSPHTKTEVRWPITGWLIVITKTGFVAEFFKYNIVSARMPSQLLS